MRSALAFFALGATVARGDSTSGIDSVLLRSSYDATGLFGLEGGRLMPRRDLSFKLELGYARSPLDVAVPGIGGSADTTRDPILDYLVTIDMAFGITLLDRLAIGLDVGGYRTATGAGYGERGRYSAGTISQPSNGLIALRPLSNIDQSAHPSDRSSYLGDGLAGPLDARVGIKLGIVKQSTLAVAAIASVTLPFGEDQMLLGDRDLVFEPRLAVELRPDPITETRLVANLAARIRNRSVLEGYDTQDPMATADDAKVFLDVGSEMIAGVGGMLELSPRAVVGIEAQAFVPLPTSIGYGRCTRFNGLSCTSIGSGDYWGDAKAGDLTTLFAVGMRLRLSADVAANLVISSGLVGARGDDYRFTTGLTWSPQPAGAAVAGRNDRDSDGIPDAIDGCRDEAEDKDGYQDEDGCPDPDNDGDGIVDPDDSCADQAEDQDGFQDGDGCPERDNDHDTIPDAADRCTNEAEDKDGFEDDDGCPDVDNDGDDVLDATDRCPNDPETVNGFEDDDGCPDVRAASGPEERPDRIDLKGQQVVFDKAGRLTAASRALLAQVAAIIVKRSLTIRIEAHLPLGTKAVGAAAVKAQKVTDKRTAQRRAAAIREFLFSQGVALTQLQAVGIGSARPLGNATATDPINERIELIKVPQSGTP